MDKHLIFYVMFFPTVIFFFWGMGLHISTWLEGRVEGSEQATKWEKFKILSEERMERILVEARLVHQNSYHRGDLPSETLWPIFLPLA